MAVLDVLTEDIDFMGGTGTPGVNTSAGVFRAGFARCGVYAFSGRPTSKPFPGGPVTDLWMSCRCFLGSWTTTTPFIGLGRSGTLTTLFLRSNSVTNGKWTLAKSDGVTTTELQAEAGGTIFNPGPGRIDIQVVSFGASATVRVYINGNLTITYTGNVTNLGTTNLDCVVLLNSGSNPFSEIVVADEDTRNFPGVVTAALTGAGTTSQWSGIFSDINGTSFSDANPNFTNANNQDQQYNVTDLPAGTYVIKARKWSVRATKSVGSTPTKIALGDNSGGTVSVGSDQALTTAFDTYSQLDITNPATGVPYTMAEINALQLNFRSKA